MCGHDARGSPCVPTAASLPFSLFSQAPPHGAAAALQSHSVLAPCCCTHMGVLVGPHQTPRAPVVLAGGSPGCCGSVRSFPACLPPRWAMLLSRQSGHRTNSRPACMQFALPAWFLQSREEHRASWLAQRDIRKTRGGLGGWATCQGHVMSPHLLPRSLLSRLMQCVARADGKVGNVRATLLCAGLTLGQKALVPHVCVPAWGERPGLGRRGPS